MRDFPPDRFTRCTPPAEQAQDGLPPGAEDMWVFAYGSLMWNPDFSAQEARSARLHGWHRAMCLKSLHYRGTPDNPGLVLGLDRGGSCLGRAFLVAARDWPEVRDALHRRELVSDAYEPRLLPIRLDDGRRVTAYGFTVRRDHVQYFNGDEAEAVRLIRQGVGPRGTSRDYLASTLEHMDGLGLREGALHRLLRKVDRVRTG